MIKATEVGKGGEDGEGAQLVHGLNLLKQVLVKDTKPFNVMGYVWYIPGIPKCLT